MVISALMFATGEYWFCVGGGVLWILSYGMDYSDGIVARYKNKKSYAGDYLDSMVHRFTYPLLMTCVGWCVFKNGGTDFIDWSWFKDEYFILLGVIAGVSICIFISTMDLYERVSTENAQFKSGVGAGGVEGKFVKNKKAFELFMNVNPLSFTNMMVLLLVCAVFKILWIFIIFYAIGYFLAVCGRSYLLYASLNRIKVD